MDMIERARAVIVKPGPTWTVIEQEATDWQRLYVPYMVTLALIPAISSFIGWSVVGMGSFGVSMRLPVLSGLGLMVSQYAMTLVMVFVWGWIISQLASVFGGQANLMNVVKLSVYASTPAMLVGVFRAMPGLSILSLLGGLYSLYLVFVGLPILMKSPPDKSVAYAVVAAVAGIIGSMVISMAGSMFMPSPQAQMHDSNGVADIKISTPGGDVQISTTPIGTNAPAETKVTIKTPEGEVKVVAESMQDMIRRLEVLAAEQEKAGTK
jgi:hypothetical protein